MNFKQHLTLTLKRHLKSQQQILNWLGNSSAVPRRVARSKRSWSWSYNRNLMAASRRLLTWRRNFKYWPRKSSKSNREIRLPEKLLLLGLNSKSYLKDILACLNLCKQMRSLEKCDNKSWRSLSKRLKRNWSKRTTQSRINFRNLVSYKLWLKIRVSSRVSLELTLSVQMTIWLTMTATRKWRDSN